MHAHEEIRSTGNPWVRALVALAMTVALILPAFALPGMMATRQTQVMDGMQSGLDRLESEGTAVERHHARRVADRAMGRDDAPARHSLL